MAIWDSRSIYLTSQGSKMLAKAETGGVPMTITRAVTGSGRTSEIEGATSVSDIKQTLQIVHKSADVQGSLLDLQVSNAGLLTPYPINQIGIYASNSEMGEVLYMIAQCDEGTADTMPAEATASVIMHYKFLILHSATAEISVTITPAGTVLQEDFDVLEESFNDFSSGISEKVTEIVNYIGMTSYASDTYGVEVDFTPSAREHYKRLGASSQFTAGADFNDIEPWKRRRCILTDEGEVVAYYGDTGYTESGKLIQRVTINQGHDNAKTYPIGTLVQVMVEQPKFYYRTIPLQLERVHGSFAGYSQSFTDGWALLKAQYLISPSPKPGFKVFPLFETEDGEVDKVYLPAYRGCGYFNNAYGLDDSIPYSRNAKVILSSISGAKPLSGNLNTFNRTTARVYANNRNPANLQNTLGTNSIHGVWRLKSFAALMCSAYLFLVEYGSFDFKLIGNGVCNLTDDGTSNLSVVSGKTSTLGNNSGADSNAASNQAAVSYRGEENLWGNGSSWLDGINMLRCVDRDNNTVLRCFVKTKGDIFIPDSETPAGDLYNEDRTFEGYTDVGFVLPSEVSPSRYISRFGYSKYFDWGFLPILCSGNYDSIPYCSLESGDLDKGWRTVISYNDWNTKSGNTYKVGLLSLRLRKLNHSSRFVSASTMFVPLATPKYDNAWAEEELETEG